MIPCVSLPLRAVQYTGTELVRNGHALAVQGKTLAFDLGPDDVNDTQTVGIGIVTGIDDAGVRGTGTASTYPTVSVIMARVAQAEMDAEIMDMLRVMNPVHIRDSVVYHLRPALEGGANPEDLLVVMRPKGVSILKAYAERLEERKAGRKLPPGQGATEVQIGGVEIVEGVPEPGYLFMVMRRLK